MIGFYFKTTNINEKEASDSHFVIKKIENFENLKINIFPGNKVKNKFCTELFFEQSRFTFYPFLFPVRMNMPQPAKPVFFSRKN